MDLLKALSMGTLKSSGVVSIEDVFQTHVFTGTGATLNITTGMDFTTDDGLVWIKNRSAADTHVITDTLRGATNTLTSETTAAEIVDPDTLTAFTATGFTLGADVKVNTSAEDYVSWVFKKAPRFFDVVKYTGNGVAGREIAHDLGVAPGMIVSKGLNSSFWYTQAVSAIGHSCNMKLNDTSADVGNGGSYLFSSSSDLTLTVASDPIYVNASGQEYIAYLFADDPLGPSGDGSDGLIACGSYVGDGTTDGSLDITLGWEPQYVMVKVSAGYTDDWYVVDTIRGIVTDGNDEVLRYNQSQAEQPYDLLDVTSTGFKLGKNLAINTSGATYIYMAIRRPMRTPESSDEVFAIDTQGSTADGKAPGYRTDFPVDMALTPETAGGSFHATARLIQGKQLYTNGTNTETTNASYQFDYMNGFDTRTGTASIRLGYMWARRKGFMDVVAYTGDGVAGRTVDHNLGVVPEMIWVKNRDGLYAWVVYHKDVGATARLELDTNGASIVGVIWNDTAPTDSVFTLNYWNYVNKPTNDFIALLFATLANVSKVFSYTGDGTSDSTKIIPCGFSAGSSFVLIKRTDLAGDWYFWDQVRGIVSGTEGHLSLNTTAAEVTTDDSIDPENSGFIVNQVAATDINVLNGTYIGYAVAAI